MSDNTLPAHSRRLAFRFHADRDQLLAEAHARPAARLPTPMLATRIAALSDESDPDRDRLHMVALCRKLGAAEPGNGARWCALDAGGWRLRWERHTELSTWTFYRPIVDDAVPTIDETALDLAPQDWLAGLPGTVLVAAHLALLRAKPGSRNSAEGDEIAVTVADGALQVFTDFRPGPDAFTRMLVIQPAPDAGLAGRVVQQLFEIETYRMMALLAFPLAGEAAAALSHLEAGSREAALQLRGEGGIDADRALLTRLTALAGEAQALSGRTSFRFAAARAYYGIVQERIKQLRERRIDGRPTIAEFMERRLAPAMRTCAAVSERQERVIAHITRTSQLLNTRVEVAAEVTNANLLASMDRRANLQLRLQQTVEGLSVAAISYYALSLLGYGFKALSDLYRPFDTNVATGIAAPIIVVLVWFALYRLRSRLMAEDHNHPHNGSNTTR